MVFIPDKHPPSRPGKDRQRVTRNTNSSPDRKPLSVADWLRLPELEREYLALVLHERYKVVPDPAILKILEGES